jgi:hypothetical protein
MIAHLTAHARRDARPFLPFEAARWAWDHLRLAFPIAFAAVLMPDHLHLIAVIRDLAAGRARLSRLLGQFQRMHGEPRLWSRLPDPREIRSRQHFERDVKYLPRNPCREHWVLDPDEWMFSTQRDILGAVVDPWVDRDDLARRLGVEPRDFPRWWHACVTNDDSIVVGGTPMPKPAEPRDVPTRPLADIVLAAASSHLVHPRAVRESPEVRKTFAALARHQGWRDPAVLATQCGVTPRHMRRLLAEAEAPHPAAVLCLGDRRLLTAWPPPRRDHDRSRDRSRAA